MSFEKHYKRVFKTDKVPPSAHDSSACFFYHYGKEDQKMEEVDIKEFIDCIKKIRRSLDTSTWTSGLNRIDRIILKSETIIQLRDKKDGQ